MPAIGELRDRYTFQRRAADVVVDGLNRPGGWEGDLTVWAKTQYLKGGEGVQQARLQGLQPVILTIRASTASRAINNAWQAVDARDPTRVFNITGVEMTADRAFIQILATSAKGQPNAG